MQPLFIDASAIVAIVNQESDWEELALKLSNFNIRYSSALSRWEAVVAVNRFHNNDFELAKAKIEEFFTNLNIETALIGEEVGNLATDAFAKFGKGRHKAALNFGDCFSYACAKHLRAALLFKGDDFGLTDVLAALP